MLMLKLALTLMMGLMMLTEVDIDLDCGWRLWLRLSLLGQCNGHVHCDNHRHLQLTLCLILPFVVATCDSATCPVSFCCNTKLSSQYLDCICGEIHTFWSTHPIIWARRFTRDASLQQATITWILTAAPY